MRRVLILVENLPSPFDRRVWQEAGTLRDAGYGVSIVCPTGPGCELKFEVIDGIYIYRYRLPLEASGAGAYALEYASAIAQAFILSWRVLLTRGFDVVHACNPPDLLVLVAGFFKLFGKKFLFDHHDLAPELYEAKFGRRDFLYRLMLRLERLTFRAADVSIATNESYRQVAIARGRMPPGRVFVVRSGPDLARLKRLAPQERLKCGRRYLVGYVGVMGRQEGVDYLLRAVMNDKSTMNKIMEYMALGKPIVQFDLTEGRFSAQHASLYARRNDAVDFATKIVELVDDPARRSAMGAFGRRRVEQQLEWRHEAPRLLAAYDALWDGSTPRSVPGGAGTRRRSREPST